MNLKSLLVSSDEKTVRVLRRVLSDLEIDVEHCVSVENAIRRITRQRFEAIIVDGANPAEAGRVLVGAKAAPVNKRALAIVLVEAAFGLKGGFELGAHFVLHKPFAVERAKSSFRAVRALMKRERRMQLRLPVQVPVECFGTSRYKAKTIDLCEGGMAIQFVGRSPKENALRFSLDLPGSAQSLEIHGEVAWGGSGDIAGVRFKDATDEQRGVLRRWLNSQLPEPEQDDPPVASRLSDLSLGGCYLTTNSPFPRGTRVVLSAKIGDRELRASAIVLVAHPEFGMGVEFLRITGDQAEQAQEMIAILHANEDKRPEVQVAPDGLEPPSAEDSLATLQTSATEISGAADPLVDLFRQKFQVPVEVFLQQMREQRQALDTH
ncbi:MAG: PilZ domain-containing protein [Terriglobales bacterium]